MFNTIANIAFLIVIVAYLYITRKEIKLYKSFVKEADNIISDNKKLHKDCQLAIVYAKRIADHNKELRDRLEDVKED